MDSISREKRSDNMASIKSKNTSIELRIRKILHANGYRYILHNKSIVGKPDLFFPKYKTAVFINGCFWHRHRSCKLAYIPKSNTDFWMKKFQSNVDRDEKVINELIDAKIKEITIWECTVKGLRKEEDISKFLNDFETAIQSDNLRIEL